MAGNNRIFTKICGIIRFEDAVIAAECRADALGFIAYPKSPRYVVSGKVMELISSLKCEIRKVAVFVNPTIEDVEKYVDAGTDVIQLHGDETPEFTEKAAKFAEVWKALRPRNREDVLKYKDFPASKFLIDSYNEKAYGGTGEKADWELAKFAIDMLGAPVILSGGLNPANIADAIDSVHPFGVDLSSGIESSPGIKDHAKMRKLFEEIKKTQP